MTETDTTAAAAEAPKASKKDKTPKPPKEKKEGVGSVARAGILAGLSNDEVLAKVKAAFPDCKTTNATISWYRNNLRSKDPSVPTARQVEDANKQAAQPAQADPLA